MERIGKQFSLATKLGNPNLAGDARLELTVLPQLFIREASETLTMCMHVVWYTNPEDVASWVFDHITLTAGNLGILKEVPELLDAILMDYHTIQPQEFSQRLIQLGFTRI